MKDPPAFRLFELLNLTDSQQKVPQKFLLFGKFWKKLKICSNWGVLAGYKFKWAFNHKDKWPMDVRTFHEIRWCLDVHASNRRAMVCPVSGAVSRSLDCKGQRMGPYRPNVALVLAVLLIAKEREGTKSRLTIRKRPRSRKLPTRPTKSVLPGSRFLFVIFGRCNKPIIRPYSWQLRAASVWPTEREKRYRGPVSTSCCARCVHIRCAHSVVGFVASVWLHCGCCISSLAPENYFFICSTGLLSSISCLAGTDFSRLHWNWS